MRSGLSFASELRGVMIHPDGSHLDLGILGADEIRWSRWRQAYEDLKRGRHLPLGMGFAAFLAASLSGHPLYGLFTMGLVTTAGANYVAADWLAASANRINAFKYHDSGTGTTAATVAQTALITPTGLARVEGVQTNPSAGQMRSLATITYSSPYAVTEWGLFSAATVGTMWDRKVFGAKNVVATGTIAFSYLLTVYSGG